MPWNHFKAFGLTTFVIYQQTVSMAMAFFQLTHWPLDLFDRTYCIAAETITSPRKGMEAFQWTQLLGSIFLIGHIVLLLKS